MEPRYYQGNFTEVYKAHQKDKYEIFNKWCKDEGVLIPKLEYPAFFDGGLLGARAKQDIQHREAFLYIPFKMLMSLDYAQNHPKLGLVILENPQLFHKDRHDDWE